MEQVNPVAKPDERPILKEVVNPFAKPGEKRTFTILGCKGRIVATDDGKAHFELDCKSKKERDELSAIWEEEAILRINPKVVLDDTPPGSESPSGSESPPGSESSDSEPPVDS